MIQNQNLSLRDLFKALRFLWVAIVFMAVALALEPIAHKKNQVRISPEKTERDLHRKIDRLDKRMLEIRQLVEEVGWPGTLEKDEDFIDRIVLADDGLAFFLLQNDSLVFWSDHSQVVNAPDLIRINSGQVYHLPNSCVFTRVELFGHHRLVGFVFLKKFFPYNNQFVSDAFLIGKRIPSTWEISLPPIPGSIRINDPDGKYLFSIVQVEPVEARGVLHWIVLSLYGLVFLALLLLLRDLLMLGYRLKEVNWWLLALLGDLFLLRLIPGYFRVPRCLFELDLFTPFQNGLFFLESRGDVLFTVVLILFFAYWFFKLFRLFPRSGGGIAQQQQPRTIQSLAMIGWFISILLFFFSDWLVRYINDQRPDLLEIHRVLSVEIGEVLDIFLVIAAQAASLLVLYAVVDRIRERLNFRQALLGFILMVALLFGLSRSLGFPVGVETLIFLILAGMVILCFRYVSARKLSHAFIITLLVLMSAYQVIRIDQANRVQSVILQERIVEELSNERDPIAEMLLNQYEPEIRTDSVLREMVIDPEVPQMEIASYLKSKYFGLYWNRYEIQPLICDQGSQVLIQPDLILVPCLEHFITQVKGRFGIPLNGTEGFYFLDNFDGLIDYLGLFRFYQEDSTYATHLIINIDSRLVTQELGYPELLITGPISRDSLKSLFSYAKYHRGFLQSTTGEYNYSFTSDMYPSCLGEKVLFHSDGYEHMIYRMDEENEMIISRPAFRLIDYLIAFSYLFVFLFLTWHLARLIWALFNRFRFPEMVLKQRIQFSMVLVLIVSFLVIGGGMTFYVIGQYNHSTRRLIEDKTGTLLTDIQYKLNMHDSLSRDWSDQNYRSLDELLIKFSYVFNTDINLFAPDGNLLASSRPEIFEFNLVGGWMNPLAFNVMHNLGKPSFIHQESIEGLGFLSSYIPIFNQNDRLIAYLNLPYFSKQSQIRNEVSTIVVAMLNVYLVVILFGISLAVLIANQVTRPLRLLKEKLAGLRLGRRNQPIEYRRSDEIGQLVNEYNRMVAELQESANKLARSEREMAWREMARQIAHEIKNPLTPMKLSVQHLRRAWKDEAPNLGDHIDRVTRTLIDQIDNLSAIAIEFSRFAKMPGANFEKIDLVSKIPSIMALYEESCQILFDPAKGLPPEVWVLVDKEQLLQVFNNLIRNAIQAVPDGAEPKITIALGLEEDRAIIRVTDNGAGIPEELQSKMFEPNFTTKSSGMGLGLAISKRIVEGSGGEISFDTTPGRGTTFEISLPLYREEEPSTR